MDFETTVSAETLEEELEKLRAEERDIYAEIGKKAVNMDGMLRYSEFKERLESVDSNIRQKQELLSKTLKTEMTEAERASTPVSAVKAQEETMDNTNRAVSQTCSKCGAQIKPQQLFCTLCGNRLKNEPGKCPRCGLKVSEKALFCTGCGYKL